MSSRRFHAGFTLLEMLIVFAIIAIVAATLMPNGNAGVHDQLDSVARVVASDLAYARSLAVTYDSMYRVTFDTSGNQYILEHSGANGALDALPDSAFRNSDDPPNQHIVNLDDLPQTGTPVELGRVVRVGGSVQDTGDVEFGPLGGTTQSEYTVVLLAAGEDADRRRAFVVVNPVTGLTTIAHSAAEMPSAVAIRMGSIQ